MCVGQSVGGLLEAAAGRHAIAPLDHVRDHRSPAMVVRFDQQDVEPGACDLAREPGNVSIGRQSDPANADEPIIEFVPQFDAAFGHQFARDHHGVGRRLARREKAQHFFGFFG
jgi:hypothetical protein